MRHKEFSGQGRNQPITLKCSSAGDAVYFWGEGADDPQSAAGEGFKQDMAGEFSGGDHAQQRFVEQTDVADNKEPPTAVWLAVDVALQTRPPSGFARAGWAGVLFLCRLHYLLEWPAVPLVKPRAPVGYSRSASAGQVEAAFRKWQPEWVGSSVPGAIDQSKPSRPCVSGACVFKVAKSSGHSLMP